MRSMLGASRFAIWRRTAGVLAVLALVAQAAPLLACAVGPSADASACDDAMERQGSSALTHLDHAAAASDVRSASDLTTPAPGCGDNGMAGRCLQQCVPAAIRSGPALWGDAIAPELPAPSLVAHLIGIPPTADSPPPKG